MTVTITDVDEDAPVFSSGSTASLAENAAVNAVVYNAQASDNNGAAGITYSLSGAAAFSIDAASGAVSLNTGLDFEAQSRYDLVVTATDATGNVATQAVTVTITDVDEDAPVFSSGSTASLAENAAVNAVVYNAQASDNNGAAGITYSLSGAAAFSIDAASGAVSLNTGLDFEAQSSYALVVTATDATGNQATQAVTVTITDVDEDAPVFSSGATASLAENAAVNAVVYNAQASDAGGGITYSLSGAAAFSIDAASGAVSLNTGLDFEAQSRYDLVVTATDATGNVATQAVTVTVTDVDEDAPVFSSGSTASLAENAAVNAVVYNAQASDNNGAAGITYSLSGAAAFSIDAASGAVSLNTGLDFEAQSSYALVVTATDATGNQATQAVTVTVTDVDEDAPVFSSGSTASLAENAAVNAVVYNAQASDAGGGITYSLSGAAAFSIDAASGAVSLNTGLDFEAQSSYALVVTATDATGNQATQAVTVTITDVDEDAPVFSSGSTASLAENAAVNAVVYNAQASDNNGAAGITYSLSGAAAFSIDAASGAVSLNTGLDFEAQSSYALVVTATDATGNQATQAVTVTITDVDEDAPVFSSGATASLAENAAVNAVVYNAQASDAGGGITYSLSGAAAFSIDAASGAVSLNTGLDFEAQSRYDLVVTATDATGNVATQAVTVTVTDVDEDAPVFSSGSTASLAENAAVNAVVYNAQASDAGGGITYSLSGAAAFSIDAASGAVSLNTGLDFEAQSSYALVVTATDATGNVATQAVTVTITDVDEDAPVFSSGSTASLAENAAVNAVVYNAQASDNNGAAGITYSLSGAAAFSIDAASGAVSLNTGLDFEAQSRYDLVVTATDATGNVATQAVTVTITDVDEDAPVFSSGSTASLAENAAVNAVVYNAQASDNNGAAGITYSLSGAAAFSIDAASGAVSLNTGLDFEAQSSYALVVTATDATGNQATQAVTVTITDVDEDAPVFSSGATASLAENAAVNAVVYNAQASDAGGGITYSLSGAAAFSIDAASGAVSLNTGLDFEAQSRYDLVVTATDATGNVATQAVTVTVTDVDEDAPVFSSGSTASLAENAAVNAVVYNAQASDAGGGITYSLSGAAAFSIDAASGAVSLNTGLDFEAQSSYALVVTATDATGNVATQAVTVTITDVDEDAPVFSSGSTASLAENAAVNAVVYNAQASDNNGAAGITYSLSGAAAFSIDAASGAVSLNTGLDFEAQSRYDLVVTATDATGNVATQAVTVTITDVDEDAPVFSSGSTASLAENAAVNAVVYNAQASDNNGAAGITYSLSGAAAFSIDAASGAVSLNTGLDFEAQSSYALVVTATDATGNQATQAVTVTVTDVDEDAPVFSSGSTASLAENAAVNAVVYNAQASDAGGGITYSLSGAAAFSIDAASGAVSLNTGLDFEAQSSYALVVTATDATGNQATQAVTVTITDVDEDAPVFSSGSTASLAENAAVNAVVYNAQASDNNGAAGITYSLSGAAAFSIDAASGAVSLNTGLDFEAQSSYALVVTATDATGNVATQAVTVTVTDVDEAPTGLPTITGTVTQGATLTADASGITDADGLGAFSYQWQADGSAINGATGASFELTQEQVGDTITVTVSYTDGGGTDETLTSAASAAVTNTNDDPDGAVTISGTASEGETLTADTSAISDADGLGAFSYQWQADGSAINGATGTTFELTQAQVGETITVKVSYTDGGNTAETLISAATATVTNTNDAPTGLPTIDGTATQGETLTADASGITDADGLGAFSYQWQADGSAINGATGASFELTQEQVGDTITVTVSYTDGGGTDETLTSAATNAVTNTNDAPTGLPTITGTATQGEILIADASGITDADGLGAFSYQWQADGSAINGATGTTFELTQDQVGKPITVTVSYTDGGNTAETLTSAATNAVTNTNDAPTGLPTITGTATQGATLTVNTDSIADADGLGTGGFSYQWQAGGNDISGATGETFELTQAQVGATITVKVSYTDGGNTAESLTSAATSAITNTNDEPTGAVTIDGIATQGEILTANTDAISDADGLGAFSYQWQAGGTAISGADEATFELTQAQVGETITVTVSYTDGGSTEESLTSIATSAVTNTNDDPTGAVTIDGIATQGEILTANTDAISDADGLGAFSYQWQAGGTAISGADEATFELTQAQVGETITVTVSYTDGGSTEESLTSIATSAVTNTNDDPTGLPTITGTPTQGAILTVNTDSIADADGFGNAGFSYQWQADATDISGATDATFELTQTQVGKPITVTVSYTDDGNTAETLTSAATNAVTNTNDAPTGLPSITGTVTQGETLTADASGITDADGLGAFSYQWQADGSAINGATGSTLALTQTQVGNTITVTVSYTDGGGTAETVNSAATSAVTNVNDAPTIIGTPITAVAEDTAYSFIPTGADVDAGAILVYSIANKPSWATFSTTTGALTGTPDNDDVGTTSGIVITLTSGGDTVSLPAFDLAVSNENDAPTIIGTPDTTVAEDSTYSFIPIGADVDAGAILVYSIANKPSWATFSTTTGALTGTPTNADVGSTSGIVITLTSGGDTVSLPAFDLAVSNENDAPTIIGTPITAVAEDTAYSFIPTGADVDAGAILVYSIANKPSWATFSTTTGALTGTPDNDDVGTTSGIVITLTSGGDTVSLPAFDLAVSNENDAPTIIGTPDTTVAEDSTYSFIPIGADVDAGAILVYSIANKPSWATFSTTTGALTGTPTNADVGSTSGIVITLTSGGDTVSLPAFDLAVSNENDAPTIIGTPDTTVAEDTAYSFIPTGADVDAGAILVYSIANKPSWATFSTTTGALTGTPTNADVGSTSGIVITLTSGGDTVSLPAFDLAVSNENDAPTIIGTPDTTVAEDTAYSFIPTGADVDAGAILVYSIANKPSWATFSTTTGALTGTPTNADVGSTSGIVITLTSSGDTVSLPAFDLAVSNENDAPTIIGRPDTTVAEDTAYSFIPTGADVDAGAILVYSIANKPSWATFSTTTGALTGTPTNADVGSTSGIVITLTSGGDTVSLPAFDLAVSNVNDAPTITGTPDITVEEDTAYSFTPTGADVDAGAILVYSIAGKPDWADFDTTTGALTGTPTNADVGTTSGIVISVSDGTLTTPLQTFDLAVTNTNDAPVGLPTITGTVTQGATLTAVTSGIVDVDGLGSFSYQWQADGRAIRGADEATFVPTQAQVGAAITVTVSYTDDGGTAESLTSAATSAVTDEIPPVFSGDDSARLPRNAAEFVPIYNAQASDNNGAADAGITYSLGEMNTPDFRINPNDGEVVIKTRGSIKDSYVDLKVTATDAAGNQATKTVPVTVTAADNTVPVFSSAATASVVENTSINTVVYDAQARDAGQGPDVNIFYGLEGADATAFKIDAGSGEVRLKETADFETKNSYALKVVALDAAGNKATQAVTVTVIDVEDVVFTFEEHRATDVILHTVSAAEGVAIPVFNFVHSDGGKDTTSEDGNLIFRNGNKGEIFFTQEGTISEVNNHGVLTSNINESPYMVEVTGSAGTVEARTLQFVAKVTESLAPYFVDSFGAPLALPTATAPQFMSSLIGDDSGLHYSKVFSSPVYVADEENGISGYKDSSGMFVYSGNTNTLTRTPNTDLQDSGSSNNWAPSKFTFGEAGSGLIFRFGDSDSDSYVVPDTGTDTNWTVTNPAHKAVGPSTGNIFIDNNNDGTYDEKVDGVGDDLIANLVAGSGRLITTFQKETSATTDDVSALLQSLHFGYLGQKPTEINILANDGDSDNPDADNDIDHTQDYSVAVV